MRVRPPGAHSAAEYIFELLNVSENARILDPEVAHLVCLLSGCPYSVSLLIRRYLWMLRKAGWIPDPYAKTTSVWSNRLLKSQAGSILSVMYIRHNISHQPEWPKRKRGQPVEEPSQCPGPEHREENEDPKYEIEAILAHRFNDSEVSSQLFF